MIPEIIFNVVFVALAGLSFYYLSLGKKYEGDMEKKVLGFFSLGLFFVLVKSVANIAVQLGVGSHLLSSTAVLVYSYLVPICFFFGAYFLKDLILTSE
jgi:hypothetical protein